MSENHINLRSQILIAMPSLSDPNFSKSITLICEHSDTDGAMGIVLNQPTTLNVDDLFSQLNIPTEQTRFNATPVFAGGPVQTDHGFILHTGEADTPEWKNTIEVNSGLYLTSSDDILHDIASGHGPDSAHIALGYAGWGPGQLEAEIQANSWLTTEYEAALVFDTPAEQQWLAAGNILGIDLNLLSTHAGHA